MSYRVTITLSVGRVAGLVSPTFLDLTVTSISSGTNLLRGLSVSVCGVETGVGSGVGNGLAALLLLNVVSTGWGKNLLFAGAKSFCSTPPAIFGSSLFSFLLLLVVSSTGWTAQRLAFGGVDMVE